MSARYLERTVQLQSLLASMANVAAIALLALVLAHWTWALLAPAPAASAAALPPPTAARVAAPTLFGLAPAQEADAAPSTLAITLLGTVVATSGRRGQALVRLGDQASFVVREGASLAPGVTLIKVGPDRIVIERAGQRETLAWPRPDASTPALLSGVQP